MIPGTCGLFDEFETTLQGLTVGAYPVALELY